MQVTDAIKWLDGNTLSHLLEMYVGRVTDKKTEISYRSIIILYLALSDIN